MTPQSNLQPAERMELIGRMASSLAHDFSNVLMTISACTRVLLHQADAESMREPIELIQRAASHGSNVVRRLLTFGRDHAPDVKVVDLNDLLRSMFPIFRMLGGPMLVVKMDLAGEPCRILADPVEIELALLNLVRNSADAMPSGGVMTVSTRIPDRAPDDTADGSGGSGERFVKLVLFDTGVGMDPEAQSRVFQPFYTTKPGRGAGLGLPTVEAVVKRYRGHIRCRSGVNQGTAIIIQWPLIGWPPM